MQGCKQMEGMRRLGSAALALLVGIVPVVATAAAPSFKDKKIEITVGYGVAGGPDVIARLVSRHLNRFIPGNPTLFVMNRPGAEGVVQTDYMANLAPSDGLSIAYISRASALAQIANRPGVRFDMAAFRWLGALSQESIVVFVRRDKGFASVAEMKRAAAPLVYAVRAPGGTDFLAGKALEALGVPLKVVSGYGSGQTTLAFEQGEIDASALTEGAFRQRRDWLKPDGLAVVVVEFGAVRPHGAAFGADLTPLAAKSAIYALINKALSLPVATFAAPPATPPEITDMYRTAFSAMERDAQFLEDARKSDIEINPVTGADLQTRFTDFLNAPPAAKAEFAGLVE
jgi:tripartite-type tricarboxylate transporter receptor subunit TctC